MVTEFTSKSVLASDCSSSCESSSFDRTLSIKIKTPVIASWIDVAGYENKAVINRMVVEDGYSESEAVGLFEDLKKFLFLAGTNPDGQLAPTKCVDDAWHAFVLHTRDYMEFCNKHFGLFIHHVPNAPALNVNGTVPMYSSPEGCVADEGNVTN